MFVLPICFLARGGLSCNPPLETVKAGPERLYLSEVHSPAGRNGAERTWDTEAGQRLSLDVGQAVASPAALGSWFICPESLTPGRQGVSYLCKTRALECVPTSLALGAPLGGLIESYDEC